MSILVYIVVLLCVGRPIYGYYLLQLRLFLPQWESRWLPWSLRLNVTIDVNNKERLEKTCHVYKIHNIYMLSTYYIQNNTKIARKNWKKTCYACIIFTNIKMSLNKYAFKSVNRLRSFCSKTAPTLRSGVDDRE